MRMTIDGLKELLADSDKSELAGISFGGQMHGLVILDDQDQVIRPAILWNDGRTTKETAYLNEVIGKETAFRIYCKYCIYRLYGAEDSVGKGK